MAIGGVWFTVGRFKPLELSSVGARVRLHADDKHFIQTFEPAHRRLRGHRHGWSPS
jgi:hypothetical protein